VESIPIFVSTFLFRGGTGGRGSRSAQVRNGGSLQPFVTSESATMGCSSNFGGGEPSPTWPCGVRVPGEGGSFTPSGSAHVGSSSSSQPVVGATDSGFVTPPASSVTKSGDLPRFTFRCALQHLRVGADGVGVARCPLVSKETGYEHAVLPLRRQRGKRGQTRKRTTRKGSGVQAGEDWAFEGCARALFVSCRSR
jgi:hypothetical protein